MHLHSHDVKHETEELVVGKTELLVAKVAIVVGTVMCLGALAVIYYMEHIGH